MVTQVHEPNKLVLAVNHNHMGYKLDAWAHSAIKLHIYGKIHCLGHKIGKCSIKCQNITISNLAKYMYIYGLLHDKCHKVYSMVDMNLHYLDLNI